MDCTTPVLQPSVMTSSSIRKYDELFNEINRISGVNRFDLFLIRDIDIERMSQLNVPSRGRLSEVLSDETNVRRIKNGIVQLIEIAGINVPAVATYLPDVSSVDSTRRDQAICALANCADIAIAVALKDGTEDRRAAVVEMVCGTSIEGADDGESGKVYGTSLKMSLLVRSLVRALELVESRRRDEPRIPLAFALEFEPGETYVLNSVPRLLRMAKLIDSNPLLRNRVGFNLDIAHMRIAGIAARDLNQLMPMLVHAHISDHPWIHTHDQIVGSWTNVERVTSGYQPYLRLLLDRSRHHQVQLEQGRTATDVLPFTNSIAIELEGCNRIFAIHDSVKRLEHAIAIAEGRYAKL